MGNIRFNLPDDLHWDLKRRATDERITLKELVMKALQEYLEQHPPEQRQLSLLQPAESQQKE